MNGSDYLSAIDRLFTQFNKAGSPGIALAVIHEGDLLVKKGYGFADIENNVPITPATVFNIGSESKQFTAMAVHLLIQDGQLSLDDHVVNYLPRMKRLGSKITIRHLMHHTSGLRDLIPLSVLAGWRAGDVTVTEDIVNLLSMQRDLNFDPGEEHEYSNSGYVLLAKIVEAITDMPFAKFCQEQIFLPLGMVNTLVHDDHVMLIPNRARSYYYDESKDRYLDAVLTDTVVGSTNVYTTVEDLALWHENFYSGRVGGMELIGRMHRPGKLNDGTELEYASGLFTGRRHQGFGFVEHGGGQAGYGCWTFRFPYLRFSVILMCNKFMWELREFALKVVDQMLPEITDVALISEESSSTEEAIIPKEIAVKELEEKVGTYINTSRGLIREVIIDSGILRLMDLDLAPIGSNEFIFEAFPESRVVFTDRSETEPATLQIISDSGSITYHRADFDTISPADLSDYKGTFYSHELDLYWEVNVHDDSLAISRRKYGTTFPIMVARDTFKDDWSAFTDWPTEGMVTFTRDKNDKVMGFRVSCERLRGLKFFRGMSILLSEEIESL